MITKVLIALAVATLVYSYEPKLRVNMHGRQAFVESDEVLEGVLSNILVPSYNVFKVDVDDELFEGTYRVKVYATENLGADFDLKLQDVLRTDLGFTDASLTKRKEMTIPFSKIIRSSYDLQLNPVSSRSILEALANEVMRSRNLSLEDFD